MTEDRPIALTDAERQHLADRVLGGAEPSPLMVRAVEDIIAARRVQIQTVDAAVVFHRMDRLIAEAEAQGPALGTAWIVQVQALKAMRDALRLPPGSGGTGARTARERAFTGQPRARWGPPGDPDAP